MWCSICAVCVPLVESRGLRAGVGIHMSMLCSLARKRGGAVFRHRTTGDRGRRAKSGARRRRALSLVRAPRAHKHKHFFLPSVWGHVYIWRDI